MSGISNRDIFLCIPTKANLLLIQPKSICCPGKNMYATEGIVSLSVPVLQMKINCTGIKIAFLLQYPIMRYGFNTLPIFNAIKNPTYQGGATNYNSKQVCVDFRSVREGNANEALGVDSEAVNLADGDVAAKGHNFPHRLQITIPSVFLHERRGTEVVNDTLLSEHG